jgi:hypothetical protein
VKAAHHFVHTLQVPVVIKITNSSPLGFLFLLLLFDCRRLSGVVAVAVALAVAVFIVVVIVIVV